MQDEPEKKADDEGTHARRRYVGSVGCRFSKRAPPTLLELTVKLADPRVHDGFFKKAQKDDGQRIPERLEVRAGAKGVYGSAVRTSAALYPERLFEGLEVAEGKAVPPEADTATDRAPDGLLPGISSAEFMKLLYINPAV
jgi:hypothetical protein